MTERILIGLVALAIGLVLCFAGYRFFRVMIALWGFLVGVLVGSQVTVTYGGANLIGGALPWIVGIVLGIILALLAYTLYQLAIAILGAGVGYSIGTTLMVALGYGKQPTAVLIGGFVLAVIFALIILVFHLVKLLLIINTALGGAGSIITGWLLLLNILQVSDLKTGLIGSFIQHSPVWGVAWLALAALGIILQALTTRNHRIPTTYASTNATRAG
jgi:hypothetical protein